jgi:intein-encoded DNA endonuclease-like protein
MSKAIRNAMIRHPQEAVEMARSLHGYMSYTEIAQAVASRFGISTGRTTVVQWINGVNRE